MRCVYVVLALSLAACSGDDGKDGEGPTVDELLQNEAFVAAVAAKIAQNTDAKGPQGPAGRDGMDGAPGAEGPRGADGMDGMDGAPGAEGPPGADGAPAPFMTPCGLSAPTTGDWNGTFEEPGPGSSGLCGAVDGCDDARICTVYEAQNASGDGPRGRTLAWVWDASTSCSDRSASGGPWMSADRDQGGANWYRGVTTQRRCSDPYPILCCDADGPAEGEPPVLR